MHKKCWGSVIDAVFKILVEQVGIAMIGNKYCTAWYLRVDKKRDLNFSLPQFVI